MRISEIFCSIQGEGRLVGTPSLFIRTSGCNLRCVWCDTPYTSWRPEGSHWPLAKILRRVEKHAGRYIVITGGEPMVSREIGELTSALKQRGKHITIETAGTLFQPVCCDLISLSPKLAHATPWKREEGRYAAAHEARRLNFPVLQKYIDSHDYQIKFVVDKAEDFEEIGGILCRLANVDRRRVLIMAQATTRRELSAKAPWIVERCLAYDYCYTPRLHIELFGNRRGT